MGAQVTPPPDKEDFLSRWSARKRAEAVPAEPDPVPAPEPDAPPEPPEADPDLLANLPRIEDIGPGTDIRAFLQAGVPRALKNAALRKAWAANPLIANYEDPARDYFWDYNTPGGISGFGGKIGLEDVAKMADRISGGAPDAPRPDPAEELAPQPPDDSSDVPPHAPDAPPAAVAQATPSDPAPAEAPQRRHGGAMPS
jgi:hypothetical protein